MISDQRKINHLYWRASFGPHTGTDYRLPPADHLKLLFEKNNPHEPISLDYWKQIRAIELQKMPKEARVEYRKNERKARYDIIEKLLDRYAGSNNLLREKVTFFWMSHFACRIGNPAFMMQYYNIIATNALGSFHDLLKEILHNAAMIQFLNNNQNRKSHPNENLARELMELFTLGRGNYTEKDVQECARALTGWAFDHDGIFVFRKEHHDTDTKTILGKTGNFDGNDIVNILLEKKDCARFITRKIYSWFVNESIDEHHLEIWSEQYYQSGYRTDQLLKSIFSSAWFYDSQNIGTRIKSPVDLITGITRDFKIRYHNSATRFQIMGIMGQILFDPPNVAGWPRGKNWIDSSTMMYRNRLPEVLLTDAESLLHERESFDAQEAMMTGVRENNNRKKVQTEFEVKTFTSHFNATDPALLIDELSQHLLQLDLTPELKSTVQSFIGTTPGPAQTLQMAIYLMSLPHYQLC